MSFYIEKNEKKTQCSIHAVGNNFTCAMPNIIFMPTDIRY